MKSLFYHCIHAVIMCSMISIVPYAIHAQIPSGMSYQSIVRDNTGKPLENRSVSIRFSVLKGSVTGNVVYAEEHRTVTNAFGLTNVYIGYGFPIQGSFDQVPWSEGGLYLKVEMDPNGGSNFDLSNVSPFLSVPYALFAKTTLLEAGPGIGIVGNRISNTGDPDPNDDLKSGSTVSGDLSGTLPAPRVSGIQGRIVQDIQPQTQQALLWDGNKWAPGTVDTDPSNDLLNNAIASGDLRGNYPSPLVQGLQGRPVQNVQPVNQQALVWNTNQWSPFTVDVDPANDLLIGSSASGDLLGSYPAPKVVKLNGYPLTLTTPDSGDVLVFNNSEWTHRPIGSGSGDSHWVKSGMEISLADPVNVKKVNTGLAGLFTQNQVLAHSGSDSTRMTGSMVYQTQTLGNTRWWHTLRPASLAYFSGTNQTMELTTFLNQKIIPYSSLTFFDLDPTTVESFSSLEAGGLSFSAVNPERMNLITNGYIDMYRKVKENPLEYSGIFVTDSFLQFDARNKTVTILDGSEVYGGGLYLMDKSGKDRVWISYLEQDPTQGYITVFSGKTNREAASLVCSNSAGELYLVNSNTQKLNFYAGYSNIGANYPFAGLIGTDQNEHAGMFIDQFNDGYVFADVKSFRMKDPENEEREIWYACLEGPEAAAYVRGTSQLSNGVAFVKYPAHFVSVVNAESVTIMLTPGSAETYGLAVVEKNKDGFLVKELQHGVGNFSFDWEVKGVRKGKEHFAVYRTQQQLRTNATETKKAGGPPKVSDQLGKRSTRKE